MSNRPGPTSRAAATTEPRWLRAALIGFALVFLFVFLVLPLAVVFYEAFGHGLRAYWGVMTDRSLLASVRTTAIAVGISVPLNILFGVAAAWCVTKFNFPGRNALVTLIELPFSVSPVIGGLVFVLIFGAEGWFGEFFVNNAPVIYAMPGIVLATAFITFPFVARELIPLMEAQGTEEEGLLHGWDSL